MVSPLQSPFLPTGGNRPNGGLPRPSMVSQAAHGTKTRGRKNQATQKQVGTEKSVMRSKPRWVFSGRLHGVVCREASVNG